MSITSFATAINEATGAEGPELEMLTFWLAAVFADAMGDKKTGDYFDGRCQQAKAKMREESN